MAKTIIEADSLTRPFDEIADDLVTLINARFEIDAVVERVEFVTVLDRSTLTVTVSWDPNEGDADG